MSEGANSRIGWIDTVKGIGIFFVVLGHTFALCREYIFSFHMPLFFFISGYCYGIKKEHGNFAEFLKSKLNSLIYPYILFGILSILLTFLVRNQEVDILIAMKELILAKRSEISVNLTLWFLPCLFVIETLVYIYIYIIYAENIH